MAIYNEILVGRFSRMLQKLFGMKGTQAAKQLSGEIYPSFPLFSGVENRYLEGWQRFAMTVVQVGAAANLTDVVLRNPAGSGVLAIVEEVLISNGVATTSYQISTGNATAGVDKAVVQAPQILDRRAGSQTGSALKLTSGTTLGGQIVGTVIKALVLPNPGIFLWPNDENQEIPLLPGDGFQVEEETVNQLIVVSLTWRQRSLEESEST